MEYIAWAGLFVGIGLFVAGGVLAGSLNEISSSIDNFNEQFERWVDTQVPDGPDEFDEYPDAPIVCAELYQVIGYLASHYGIMEHPDVQKALDNASQHKLVHADLLPWPKHGLPGGEGK